MNQDFDRPHIDLIVELEAASGVRQSRSSANTGEQASVEVDVDDEQPWVEVAYWGENPEGEAIDIRLHDERPLMD